MKMNNAKYFGQGQLMMGLLATTLMVGCQQLPVKTGSEDASTVASGSAGGANAKGANANLERCETALGTVAIDEDRRAAWWYQASRYGVESTIPILRLLAQQSNCFVVVERGRRGLEHISRERELEESGELRTNSNYGKGQLVAADYTVIPSLVFRDKNTGGLGGALGGVLGSVGAIVGGSLKFSDAQSVMTLVDNRSGVQVAAAEGSARGTSLGGLLGLGGREFAGALGSYAKTPEAKVVVGAMFDAFNNLVSAARNYQAQSVDSPNGLGTGGALNVSGSSNAGNSAANQGQNSLKQSIVRAQQRLNELGYNAGAPDGVIGNKTKTAIRQFQYDYGLKSTGRFDKGTLNLLLN